MPPKKRTTSATSAKSGKSGGAKKGSNPTLVSIKKVNPSEEAKKEEAPQVEEENKLGEEVEA
jgi:hypothetical protein